MFQDRLEKGAVCEPCGSWGMGMFQAEGIDNTKA